MARHASPRIDVPAFLGLVLMLFGAVFVLVCSRVALSAARPDRVRIGPTRALSSADAAAGPNAGAPAGKRPVYVEVWPDRALVEGRTVIPVGALEGAGSAFERLLEEMQPQAESTYVVLLVHPGAAPVARRMKSAVRARKLDVGIDLAAPASAVRP